MCRAVAGGQLPVSGSSVQERCSAFSLGMPLDFFLFLFPAAGFSGACPLPELFSTDEYIFSVPGGLFLFLPGLS